MFDLRRYQSGQCYSWASLVPESNPALSIESPCARVTAAAAAARAQHSTSLQTTSIHHNPRSQGNPPKLYPSNPRTLRVGQSRREAAAQTKALLLALRYQLQKKVQIQTQDDKRNRSGSPHFHAKLFLKSVNAERRASN